MKKLTLCLLTILLSLPVMSQGIATGYRAFGDVGLVNYFGSGTMNGSSFEITTTHGYQVSPHFFIGGGIGFIFSGDLTYGDISGYPYIKRDARVDMPLFFDANIQILKSAVSPIIDFKAGACINDDFNPYVALAAGCRFPLGGNIGLSVKAAVVVRKVSCERLDIVSGNKYNNYRITYLYEPIDPDEIDGLYFGVSLDF